MSGSTRTALRSLRSHHLRSALTMLGIIIGVAAVVVMIAIGVGARERIAAQIRSLGANLISISPGSAKMGSVRLGAGGAPRLSEEDATAIGMEIPGVVVAAPLLHAREQFTIGSSNWQGVVRGVTPEYFSAREWRVIAGQEMTPEDNKRVANVVLLGTTMREKLFGRADPVGAAIRIRDVPFTVIGLLERKGQSVWGDDQDDVALVPLKTVRRQFIGTSRANPTFVHSITVKFANWASAEDTMAAIRNLLWQRHRLRTGQEDSFVVSNLAEAANVEGSTTRVVSLLLSAVASISLVVGGIGIMNIMLVTVTERVREIGLRLAVGARRRDILAQFLVEAATLALLGGILGAAIGIAAAIAVGSIAQWPVIIDLSAVLLAIGFAAAVGVFFGYYPARKAARLQPIEALRTE
ncbi:MAG: FtsX-like permease family protein [Mesorhizobium sp.]|uniref:ABC transporter permease n=2 Tax=Mesorhizobium sp. TaxID=1871066 RepID=UPI000FE2B338|nr:ABC transporter permease [Mesorhizobium sp.]RWO25320.1 MAG: FtsX-like permease family protein [Mesorhizobium sp.]RWO38639.1 MAG: FtsX-like permease family protein [Mesorhizobium sp.]TIN75265.1 MAG: FtsX-like permease family protein [Mesorhizobium sp.]